MYMRQSKNQNNPKVQPKQPYQTKGKNQLQRKITLEFLKQREERRHLHCSTGKKTIEPKNELPLVDEMWRAITTRLRLQLQEKRGSEPVVFLQKCHYCALPMIYSSFFPTNLPEMGFTQCPNHAVCHYCFEHRVPFSLLQSIFSRCGECQRLFWEQTKGGLMKKRDTMDEKNPDDPYFYLPADLDFD